MNKFIGIDLSAEAAATGSIFGNATEFAASPEEAMDMMASNSLRPYIAEDGRVYCTIPRINSKGEVEYTAKMVGNGTPTPTTLLRGEWEQVDQVVGEVATAEMNLVNMLIAAGLTIPLNGMGVTKYTWQRTGRMGQARIDMDMTSLVDEDRPEFDELSMPIPIISSNWDVNMRYLLASRKSGQPVDTIKAYWAAYAVADFTERLFLNGAGNFKSFGESIPGLRTTDIALTETLSADWSSDSVTGKEIVEEVATWIQRLRAQHHYGPFTLLLPGRYSYKLSTDYRNENNSPSIMTRLLELKELKSVEFVEYMRYSTAGVDQLTNEAILLELNKKTIAVLDGMPLTDFEWQAKGPIIKQHKIAQIKLPLFRADMEGQTGILRASRAATVE